MRSSLQTVSEVTELQFGDGAVVRMATVGITMLVVVVEVDRVCPVVSEENQKNETI